MLDQLKELLEMQRVLDENIFKAKGITEYPLENMKIALFVELGELMNEFPTKFKHWKSSAKDDREKGLEEYVDCLHFALSLHNYYDSKHKMIYVLKYEECHDIENDEYSLSESMYEVVTNIYGLPFLFDIGNYLGFTWNEIYQDYKKKNEVNYERLRSGY